MRTITLLLLLFYLPFCQTVFAQDKLLLRNGDELQVKILEISPDSVHYTIIIDTVSPARIRAVAKNAVFFVAFPNGTKIVMPEPAQAEPARLSGAKLYAQGRTDAKNHYKAGNVFWATFATSAVFPVGGPLLGIPVGALATALKVPESAIIASDPEFKKEPSYLKGYRRQATNKKLGNAAAGVGAGTVLAIGVIVALLSSSH